MINITDTMIEISDNDPITIPMMIPILTTVSLEESDVQQFCPMADEEQ